MARRDEAGEALQKLVEEFLERRRRERGLTAEAFVREHPHADPRLLSRLTEAESGAFDATMDLGEAGEPAGAGAETRAGETDSGLEADRTQALPEGDGARIDGRYAVVRVLGQGGFGRVCLVRDMLHDGELRALKTALAAHAKRPEFARRFQNEIRVQRALAHRGIPQVFNDGRTAEGEFYYTMAFVDGRTLSDVLRKEAPLRPERIVGLVRQMLAILEYAHGKGVVHRDLKPANVMLVRPGAPDEEVRILDFGIAKVLRPEGDLQAAQTMNTIGGIGTPHYMSPEQIRGQDVDERSDLYALGIIIYQMCSGLLPFSGKTDLEVATARLERAPTPLEGKETPPWLREVIGQLLEREKTKRPSTHAVHVQFQKLAEGQVAVHRSLRWVMVALIVVAFGLSALLWREAWNPAAEAPRLADVPADVSAAGVPSGPLGGPARDAPEPGVEVKRGPEPGATTAGGPSAETQDGPIASTDVPSHDQTDPQAPITRWTSGTSGPPDGAGTSPAEVGPLVVLSLSVADGAHFAPDEDALELSGSAPDELSSVTVNGRRAQLSPDGRGFRVTLALEPGENEITVQPFDAERREGRATTVHVVREAYRPPAGCVPVAGVAARAGRPVRVRHEATGIELVLVEGTGRAPYYLGLHEVTRFQFQSGGGRPGPASFDVHSAQPVVQVTFDEVLAFCERNRLRLPTEAEWLFAGAGPDGRAFPWGEGPDASRSWCGESEPIPEAPREAGSSPGDVSWCGVLDLGGNVSEWTAGDEGPVIHGGSWTGSAEGCRLASRKGLTEASDFLGFRVALDAP